MTDSRKNKFNWSALLSASALVGSTLLATLPKGITPALGLTPVPNPRVPNPLVPNPLVPNPLVPNPLALSPKPMLPAPVAQKLIQQVARDTGIAPAQLKVAAVKSAQFDGCLGIYRPNQPCTMILIYGWQAIVTSPKTTFVYHLDQNGTRIAQNDTASGAGKAINVSFDLFGGDIPAVEPRVIFQQMMTGGIDGRTTTLSLTDDGKLTEFTVAPNIRSRPVVRKTLTPKQLEQFKQLLETQRFRNLNRLSYLTSAAFADYPTTTYQSRYTVTQFIDLEKKSLPASMQKVIKAWESLIR
jgi:hypothetical protein